ncbi:hypothetical protein [Salipiger sp. CCB-MM3]|uniref:hypothetical protein n=1 Tax=Salipiger sp. CCB-MM3 TaxID=1792508 RepID=UPI0012FC63C9|nr:hypothetical protein [Salipiger sp. CCB-MM3]
MLLLIRTTLALFLAVSSAHAAEEWKAIGLSGIHYAVERSSLHPDRWRQDLQHTYDCQNPCVVEFDNRLSAVHLRYKWAQLNPEEGVYKFDDLAEVMKVIHSSGKMATLVIMAGKYTPNWVLELGARHINIPAKTSDAFSQPYVPLPWDEIQVKSYNTLIEELGKFIREDSELRQTLAMVKNGLSVVHSGETRLMPTEAFKVKVDKHNKIENSNFQKKLCDEWASAGYSENKILQAIRKSNNAIAKHFPDQYIGIAYVGGSNRFPTVDNHGKCVANKKNTTINNIIKDITISYGDRSIINNTVLTGTIGNPPIMKWVRKNGGNIAFQVNRQIVGCKNGAKNPCSKEIFLETINEAIEAGAMFVEVHEGNINHFKDILPELDSELKTSWERRNQ